MNLRDEARRLSIEVANELFVAIEHGDAKHRQWLSDELLSKGKPSVESALLAFAKLVLEWEPSETAIVIGWAALKPRTTAEDCTDLGGAYRAMTAELLRELEEGK